MLDPSGLCRKHLLGEHAELHKHRHVFVRGYSIEGRRGQIEPRSMQRRHNELALEMARRGYRHKSPYRQPSLAAYRGLKAWVVDRSKSRKALFARCEECRLRFTAGRRQFMRKTAV